jgi:hypothetical protein
MLSDAVHQLLARRENAAILAHGNGVAAESDCTDSESATTRSAPRNEGLASPEAYWDVVRDGVMSYCAFDSRARFRVQ